jgi:hypothetical protein
MDWDWKQTQYGVDYHYTQEEYLNDKWKTKHVNDVELIVHILECGMTEVQISEDDFRVNDPQDFLSKNRQYVVEDYWNNVLKEELI